MSRRSGTGRERRAATGMSRREFCRLGAVVAGGLAAGAGSAWAIGPGRPDFGGRESIYRADLPIDDPANQVLTTCLGCFGACPARVAREVGAAVKLDGNPWSPRVSGEEPPDDPVVAARMRGALCARGQARLQNTHDPFRIRKPLRRTGTRGGAAWAGAEVEALRAELSAVDPASLLVAVDPRQADRAATLAAFAEATGAEVHQGDPWPWTLAAAERLLGTPGYRFLPRWAQATGVLAWGADPFASGPDPVGDSHAIAALRAGRHGGPVVVVDPRLSEVAGMADAWLPVRPGGDKALALMLLRALVDLGVAAPPESWMEPVTARPWSDLERRAGLGEAAVRRAAELLADCGPGLAIRVGGGVGERPRGADTTEAILRLAVVLGATAPGGAMPAVAVPPRPGRRPVDALPDRLAEGVLPALVVVGDGGLADTTRWPALREALLDPARVGLLVVVTTAWNPVAALADVVLPDLTELERHGLVVREDGTSLVQPAVEPEVAGAGDPWDRGLDGLLDLLGVRAGFSAADALARARAAVGGELEARGWVAPAETVGAPPAVPFGADADHSPGEPVEGLALVTWRESFGGFVDSAAQYWAQPSLRRRNGAWLHPETADALGVEVPGRLRFATPAGDRFAPPDVSEKVRPGVLGLAAGYGHTEGHDGNMVVDGAPLPRDRRRTWGIDVGLLGREDGTVDPTPVGPAPARGILERLRGPDSGGERT